MTPTKKDIEGWTPGSLLTWRDGWLGLGTSIENLFDTYVDHTEKINGEYWEGVVAEAAHGRAHSDRRTAIAVVDALEVVAGTIASGHREISGNLEAARDRLATAQEHCFIVTDDLQIIDPQTEPDEHRRDLRAGLEEDLQRSAVLARQADLDLARNLESARDTLRLVFISAATLGAAQGAHDATALASGHTDDETIHRITEAGTLTPEQLGRLRAGEPTEIPASQMEYLNALARSLDDLSPQQIHESMSTLPEHARAGLANSLQLISTDTVTVAISGDPDVPAHGGFDLLPEGIRDTLSRDDRVVTSNEVVNGMLYPRTDLNGVDDARSIAAIVAAGKGEYRRGSAIDEHLLDAGRQYLEAQVDREQYGDPAFSYLVVDGDPTFDPKGGEYFEPIFAAVADDRIVVAGAVTDPNGPDFVRDVLMHPWRDPSAVTPMFAFDDLERSVQDPNDPLDVAEATRSGVIMSSVAAAMSTDDAWTQLSNIPGADHHSIGEVNPELVRTVADSMGPYIPRMVNVELEDHPGFDNEGCLDPNGKESYRGSANVFAALNTDEVAGRIFNARAFEEVTSAEIRYGETPNESGSTYHLTTAGRILGLTDRGIDLAIQDQFNDTAAREKEIYDRKADAYNAVTWIGGHVIPGSDLFFDLVSAGGSPLEDILIGPEPDGPGTVEKDSAVFAPHHYVSLAAAPELPDEFRIRYPEFYSDDGSFKPYNEIFGMDISEDRTARRRSNLTEMFNRYGIQQGQETAMKNAYDSVRPHDD